MVSRLRILNVIALSIILTAISILSGCTTGQRAYIGKAYKAALVGAGIYDEIKDKNVSGKVKAFEPLVDEVVEGEVE